MARQATDVVALDELGPLDYRFTVADRTYRIRFEQGAWLLEEEDDDGRVVESMEVGSLGEGINLVLEDDGFSRASCKDC